MLRSFSAATVPPWRLAVTTRDAEAYVTECHRLGYFTGDPASYRASVRSLAREYTRTMPADPAPEAPRSPEAVPVSLAASVPAPEPQTPAMTPPSPATPSQPVTLPAVAAPTLPRIGEPAPLEEAPLVRANSFVDRSFALAPSNALSIGSASVRRMR